MSTVIPVGYSFIRGVITAQNQEEKKATLPELVPIFLEPKTKAEVSCAGITVDDFKMAAGERIGNYEIIEIEEGSLKLEFVESLSPEPEEDRVIFYQGCAYSLIKGMKKENEEVLALLLKLASPQEEIESLPLVPVKPPSPQPQAEIPKVEVVKEEPVKKKFNWPLVLWPTLIAGLSGLSTGLLYQQRRDAAEEKAGKAQFFQEAKENLDEAGDYDSKSKWGYGLGVPLAVIGAGGLVIYYLSGLKSDPVKVGVTFDPAQSFGLWARVEF